MEREGCDFPTCPPQKQQSPVPDSMAGGAGRAKKLGTLLSGLLECGAFCGIIFGWASLVYVLKNLGYFKQWCESSASLNPNGTLHPGTAPVSPSLSVLSPCPWCPGGALFLLVSWGCLPCSYCVVHFSAPGSCCHSCIPTVPVPIIPTGSLLFLSPVLPLFPTPPMPVSPVLVLLSPPMAALQTAAGRMSSSPWSSLSAPS